MTPRRQKKSAFDPNTFLAHIGQGRKIVSFPKGRTIFAQGDSCDAVFYIQSGKVKLTVVSKTGKEATIAILGVGEFFGEDLYKAAIFEADSNRLSERIALAEWALAVRSRELFYTDEEHPQERLAVSAAVSALQTLRSTTTRSEGRKGMHRIQAA